MGLPRKIFARANNQTIYLGKDYYNSVMWSIAQLNGRMICPFHLGNVSERKIYSYDGINSFDTYNITNCAFAGSVKLFSELHNDYPSIAMIIY